MKVKIDTVSDKKTENIPFPLETSYTKEYLETNFWKCNYDSESDNPKYWVILPKNVKPTKIEPVQVLGNLVNIGQYQTIDESNYLEIWIFYETVSETIQPSDWLSNNLKISQETVIRQNIINTADGAKYLDVLSSKIITNGEKVISRFTVLKKGANYFFIKASCNEKDYPVLADKIRHITSNWNIKD